MEAKILFQDLWRIGHVWDEVVPVDFQGRFRKWLQGLECIRQCSIPRSYAGYPWREVVLLELHGFGDASERANGACVYVRVLGQDDSWSASLVFSRARGAPLKRVSLPRLELLGAPLCSRLVVLVREALKLPKDTVCHCWTDSTVALAWIKSDPHRWKPFVACRLIELWGYPDGSPTICITSWYAFCSHVWQCEGIQSCLCSKAQSVRSRWSRVEIHGSTCPMVGRLVGMVNKMCQEFFEEISW